MLTTFPKATLLPALLAALPLLATAQNATQDSLLRRGDLIGGRPHASVPRTAAATRRASPTANADPTLAKMLHESIDLNQLVANQMPDLYSRFIAATNDQRRQWTDRDWQEASDALTRLNARYEVVRLDLPFEERLTVRGYQGEFRTLQGARRVNQKLDNANLK